MEPAEAVVTRAFEGGDGTIGDPYQISDVFQLQEINLSLDAHYVLINDIDASATVGWNSDAGFEPMGDFSNRFTGSLDGRGFEINDLFIDRTSTEYVGLFGYLDTGSNLNNIGLIDTNISGNWNVGGLAGYNYGLVSNCYISGSVSGASKIGGLVGINLGTISNCYATGSVSGTNSIGGLVGDNNMMSIVKNCHATGNVNGNSEVGGLVGINTVGSVLNCYATGYVSGTYHYIGGLVGYNEGPIENCYATGNVNGTEGYVGGLVGANSMVGMVENCYAAGNVNGTKGIVGGLVGLNEGSFENCYATGKVTGTDHTGGVVGYNNFGTFTNCFWDTETSGMATSDGGTGKVTSEMKQEVTFTGAGWDFTGVWLISDGKTYPYLKDITYSSPIVTGPDLTTAVEDQMYHASYSATTSLPGCTDLTWEIDTDATWLTISADGVLSGTPLNNDVGNHSVAVICKDLRLVSTTRSFTLSVQNTNDAPEINLTLPINATEDIFYSMVLSAIDIDVADTLNWTLESGPAWLELNITSSTLEGTPLNSDVGTAEVNVSVDDGNGGSDWQNFTITVENNNDDPIIITAPMNTTLQDELYSVTLNATDEDPVAINFTWSMDTNADWLELNGTLLTGTPGNSDVGTFWVNITVIDGFGGSHSLNYTLIVIDVNDAPVWSLTPIDQNITEGEELTLECVATDIDGDNITYSIETTPTSNLTIDPSSGVISWASPAVGTYNATITATDGTVEVQHTFSIMVNALPDEPGPVENLTDKDGDGMPNEWEELYGLDPNDASDASLDLDGDGISNLDEYKQGSDPTIDETVDDSLDVDDKMPIATICMLMALIMFIPLVIILLIVVLVVKSRKGKTEPSEE